MPNYPPVRYLSLRNIQQCFLFVWYSLWKPYRVECLVLLLLFSIHGHHYHHHHPIISHNSFVCALCVYSVLLEERNTYKNSKSFSTFYCTWLFFLFCALWSIFSTFLVGFSLLLFHSSNVFREFQSGRANYTAGVFGKITLSTSWKLFLLSPPPTTKLKAHYHHITGSKSIIPIASTTAS